MNGLFPEEPEFIVNNSNNSRNMQNQQNMNQNNFNQKNMNQGNYAKVFNSNQNCQIPSQNQNMISYENFDSTGNFFVAPNSNSGGSSKVALFSNSRGNSFQNNSNYQQCYNHNNQNPNYTNNSNQTVPCNCQPITGFSTNFQIEGGSNQNYQPIHNNHQNHQNNNQNCYVNQVNNINNIRQQNNPNNNFKVHSTKNNNYNTNVNKFSKPRQFQSQEYSNNFNFCNNNGFTVQDNTSMDGNYSSTNNNTYVTNNSLNQSQSSNQYIQNINNSNGNHFMPPTSQPMSQEFNMSKNVFNMKELSQNLPVKKISEQEGFNMINNNSINMLNAGKFNSKTMSIVEKKNKDDTKNLTDFLNSLDEDLIDFVRTQKGSRSLQKYLNKITNENLDIIFERLDNRFSDLMVDVYGNYLCQKLVICCSVLQRTVILKSVSFYK